jgi:hypothetical protein
VADIHSRAQHDFFFSFFLHRAVQSLFIQARSTNLVIIHSQALQVSIPSRRLDMSTNSLTRDVRCLLIRWVPQALLVHLWVALERRLAALEPLLQVDSVLRPPAVSVLPQPEGLAPRQQVALVLPRQAALVLQQRAVSARQQLADSVPRQAVLRAMVHQHQADTEPLPLALRHQADSALRLRARMALLPLARPHLAALVHLLLAGLVPRQPVGLVLLHLADLARRLRAHGANRDMARTADDLLLQRMALPLHRMGMAQWVAMEHLYWVRHCVF